MHIASFALLATLLPALASHGHGQPAHLRHRHLAVRHAQPVDANAAGGALTARTNEAHADAHRAIKRTVNKRGQVCRPRGQSKPAGAAAAESSLSSSSPSSSPSPSSPSQSAVIAIAAVSSAAPAAPSDTWTDTWQASSAAPAPSPSAAPASWGILAVTDSTCGWSGADSDHPNGAEDWLNCGINGGGWSPPHVTIDQLVAADLDASGVFAPCAQYIGKFNQYGGEFNIHPIMLASFAMQESTCNAGATGGNGEAGLMQIAPPNCEAGNNCWDVDYNIRRGAQLFRNMIDANGGNVLAAIGAYNGWQKGMTVATATAAKWQGNCFAQNNLDYLTQYCNGWMQNKNAHSMGSYFNLNGC